MAVLSRVLLVGLLTSKCVCHVSSNLQVPLASLNYINDAASDGCALSDLPDEFQGQDIKLSIQSGGKDRVFRVFIPEVYQPGVPTPMILSFHGHGKTAEQQQKLAGFDTDDDPAYNPGWIVVTPQGLDESWEGAPYAMEGYSDVAFTGDLLDYLEENTCVDKLRIYAAGKSNGGGFVGKLACSELSARIAAYAPVSGAFYTNVSEPCNPARTIIPIIDFHGMADTTIPYYGGGNKLGFYLDPIPDVMRAWAKRQGCSDPTSPSDIEVKDKYWRSSWSCVDGSAETIVAYNITGLKHAWPSTHPNADSETPTIINATPIIIKFFSRWTLSGPA